MWKEHEDLRKILLLISLLICFWMKTLEALMKHVYPLVQQWGTSDPPDIVGLPHSSFLSNDKELFILQPNNVWGATYSPSVSRSKHI